MLFNCNVSHIFMQKFILIHSLYNFRHRFFICQVNSFPFFVHPILNYSCTFCAPNNKLHQTGNATSCEKFMNFSLSLAHTFHSSIKLSQHFLSVSRAFQQCRRVHLDSIRVNFKNSSEDKSLMDLHGKLFHFTRE